MSDPNFQRKLKAFRAAKTDEGRRALLESAPEERERRMRERRSIQERRLREDMQDVDVDVERGEITIGVADFILRFHHGERWCFRLFDNFKPGRPKALTPWLRFKDRIDLLRTNNEIAAILRDHYGEDWGKLLYGSL